MKKILTLGLAAVTASTCVCMAGCGGTGNAAHEAGKYNLEVAVQNENGEIKMMEIWEKAYEEKHPEVNIIINNFGNDYIIGYMQKKARNFDSLPFSAYNR